MNNLHLYECNVLNKDVKKFEYQNIQQNNEEQKYILNILMKNQETFDNYPSTGSSFDPLNNYFVWDTYIFNSFNISRITYILGTVNQ